MDPCNMFTLMCIAENEPIYAAQLSPDRDFDQRVMELMERGFLTNEGIITDLTRWVMKTAMPVGHMKDGKPIRSA